MLRPLSTFVAPAVTVVVLGMLLSAQGPAVSLTLISSSGRETVRTIESRGQEMVALDDLARLFHLDVSEDSRAGTTTVSYGGEVIILTPDQQLVSVADRLVSLRSAPHRVRDGWVVPLDFLNRALAPIYDQPLELRQRSRLLLVGDVRVPKVSARYRLRPGGGQFNLEVTPNTAHTVDEEPGRLVVRFQADAIDLEALPRPRGELVTGFSSVERSPGIAVELGPTVGSFTVSSELAPEGGAEIIIELRTRGRDTTDAAPAPSVAPTTVAPFPTPADPLPDFNPVPTVRVVGIDPGHGGGDGGSQGADGAQEKDITLSVARRMRSAIEDRLGLRVILTRNSDEAVGLDERAAIANNNGADLFISLHANASARPAATGADVFYLSIDEYGDEARELAQQQGQWLPVVGGGSREIGLVLWEMAQVRYIEQSARLADVVEQELRLRVQMNPHAVQQAPFRVLVGANMPAILIEMGSISDPEGERRLTSARFQNEIVEATVATLIRFREYLERHARTVANTEYDDAGGAALLQVREP